MRECVSVDTETTGLDIRHGCRPFFVSTCTPSGVVRCWEWLVNPKTRKPIIPLKHLREISKYLSGKILVFHNTKFDVRVLESVGIQFSFHKRNWISIPNEIKVVCNCFDFEDTILASHALCSSESHNLKDLGEKYLGFLADDEKELKNQVLVAARKARSLYPDWKLGYDQKGKRQTEYDYWLPKAINSKSRVLKKYAVKDAERTILFWILAKKEMEKEKVRKGYDREKKLLPVVYQMESFGITMSDKNTQKIEPQLKEASKKSKNRAVRIAFRYSGKIINLRSPKDLNEILYESFKLYPLRKTKKGNNSADKQALEALLRANSDNRDVELFLKALLTHRTYESGLGYLTSYNQVKLPTQHPFYSVLFPSLNQSGTRTTRFSSSNPNGQNISKISERLIGEKTIHIPSLRKLFAPTSGKLWYAIDYSQLELRIFAFLSQEDSLIKALADGYDFHDYVAQKIFKKKKVTSQERRIAKNVNFAIIFGARPKKVNETAGISNAYELFANQFPNVQSFMQRSISEVKKTYKVMTVSGYQLDVPPAAPYKVVNYMVQGSAGDIIKDAMISIHKKQYVDWIILSMILQVHDELIIEDNECSGFSKSKIVKIADEMEKSGEKYGIYTPVTCDVIKNNWGEGKSFDLAGVFNE